MTFTPDKKLSNQLGKSIIRKTIHPNADGLKGWTTWQRWQPFHFHLNKMFNNNVRNSTQVFELNRIYDKTFNMAFRIHTYFMYVQWFVGFFGWSVAFLVRICVCVCLWKIEFSFSVLYNVIAFATGGRLGLWSQSKLRELVKSVVRWDEESANMLKEDRKL